MVPMTAQTRGSSMSTSPNPDSASERTNEAEKLQALAEEHWAVADESSRSTAATITAKFAGKTFIGLTIADDRTPILTFSDGSILVLSAYIEDPHYPIGIVLDEEYTPGKASPVHDLFGGYPDVDITPRAIWIFSS